jgi:hypothetical protein
MKEENTMDFDQLDIDILECLSSGYTVFEILEELKIKKYILNRRLRPLKNFFGAHQAAHLRRIIAHNWVLDDSGMYLLSWHGTYIMAA